MKKKTRTSSPPSSRAARPERTAAPVEPPLRPTVERLVPVSELPQYSFRELRGVLSEQLDKLRSGQRTHQQAREITATCNAVTSTMKVELGAMKLLGRISTEARAVLKVPETPELDEAKTAKH